MLIISPHIATNTQYLVSYHIVPNLLKLLTTHQFDSYQQLSLITCLETLIESNGRDLPIDKCTGVHVIFIRLSLILIVKSLQYNM